MGITRMNSVSLSCNAASNVYTLETGWEEVSTDAASNTSWVYVRGTLKSGNYNWSAGSTHPSTLNVYWHDNNENYDRFVTSKTLYGISKNSAEKAEGWITVNHKSDGTVSGYSYVTWTRGSSSSSYVPNDGSVVTEWAALTTIPRKAELTTTYDFNDDQNPIFYFNNPGGFWLRFALEWNNQTESIIRDIEYAPSSPYTLVLTDAERDRLRKACTGDSMPIRMVIATSIAGTYSQWSWQDKTFYRKRRINVFPQANVRKLGDPYVYTEGSYKRGIPYVYKDGSWKMGTS